MTDLDDVHTYLGPKFVFTKQRIWMHETQYIMKLLKKFGMRFKICIRINEYKNKT